MSGLLLYNQTDYNLNNPSDLNTSLPNRKQGYAGRVSYSFENKYLFEGNFAYNGSERFAAGHRFGFFPSFAVGYNISNEKFFDRFSKVITLLKLRASWGKVGNDAIGGGRFPYLSDINLTGRGYTTGIDLNYSLSGPVYNQFANPLITWEVANKTNLGVDLGLYRKLNLVVELWKEHRTNIFDDISNIIPAAFGTSGTKVFSNIGEVKAKGIDLSLDYNHEINKNLQVTSKATFTYANNTIVKNSEPLFTKYKNLSAIGHPVGTLWGYVAERLFVDDAEVAHSAKQQLGGFVQAGDIKYKDVTAFDGLNLINSDDRVAMGYPTVPQIVYGWSNSVYYKRFELSFLFQGVAKTSFFLSNIAPFGSQRTRNILQVIADDHWSPSNPDIYASYPRLSKLDNGNNSVNSSYWLRDGSFLKLRSAEVAYNYKKITRFFISGYNLLTFSKFKLWDPEQGGGNGLVYPTQRIFNIGVQFNSVALRQHIVL